MSVRSPWLTMAGVAAGALDYQIPAEWQTMHTRLELRRAGLLCCARPPSSGAHMQSRLLTIAITALMVLAASPRTADAAAGSQSKTLKPSDGTFTTTRVNVAFGDSIVAGYCGLFCRIDSYGVYYAQDVANGKDAQVDYRGRGQSGEVMSQIANRISANLGDLRAADYITLEGCGNDFLNARSSYRGQSNCTNETVLASALDSCKTNMVRALDLIAANKKATAAVRVLYLYYPGVNDDKSRSCNGTSHFDIFLDYLLEAGWSTCNEAWRRGFECVDGLAAFNAADVDTALDSDTLVDAAQIRINRATDADNFPAYYDRVHPQRAVITDAHAKRLTASSTSDYLQGDNTHPTAAGHHRLAAEHTAIGL
jgi:lysophospholipase L1-like esterase